MRPIWGRSQSLLTFQAAGEGLSGHPLPESPSEKGPTCYSLPLGLDVLEQLIQNVSCRWGGRAGC